jgi:hypothetical protein
MTSVKVLGLLLAAGLAGALASSCSSGGGGGFAGDAGSSSAGEAGSGAETGSGGSGAESSGGSAGAGLETGSGGGGGTPAQPGDPGSACTSASDCNGGAQAQCLSNGWPDGYCAIKDCEQSGCPSGSDCFSMTSGATFCLKTCTQKSHCRADYACHSAGACVPGCGSTGCDAGEVCNTGTGLCDDAPCTAGSCPAGLACDSSTGKCILEPGNGPGPGPGPDCGALPQRDCTGTSAYCGELSGFDPKYGTGYEDYPINGETATNQYRSYARRDMQMLVKYAAAYVDCKSKSWTTGNGGVIGLGDMSEGNGAIPGTSIGQPGHPAGTHLNGIDMDIAYFQVGTADNKLRPVCAHTSGGSDQYHCVSAPDKLDVWRSALFLGALFTSEIVRVIGVDGQVGPLVEDAMLKLCSSQWLPQYACNSMQSKLAYETVDKGYGWYYFHHHHLHLSLTGKLPANPTATAPELQLGQSYSVRSPQQINALLPLLGHGDGHGHGLSRRVGELPGLD